MKHKGKQQHMVITVFPFLLFFFGSSDRLWGLDRILIRFIFGTLMQPPPNRLTRWLSASEETLAWHDTADSGMSLVIRRRRLQAACIRIQRSPRVRNTGRVLTERFCTKCVQDTLPGSCQIWKRGLGVLSGNMLSSFLEPCWVVAWNSTCWNQTGA